MGLLSFSLCCIWPSTVAGGFARSVEHVSLSVVEHTVAIQILDPEIGMWATVGSGTLIETKSLGYAVLTAEHVALVTLSGKTRMCNLNASSCIFVKGHFIFDSNEDAVTDWALYRMSEIPEGISPATVSRYRDILIGERVTLIGVPFGQTPWVSQGRIAWLINESGGDLYGVDGFAVPGFSGGGAYDRSGKLIGVTIAIGLGIWGPQENQVLVVPIGNIPFKLN